MIKLEDVKAIKTTIVSFKELPNGETQETSRLTFIKGTHEENMHMIGDLCAIIAKGD